MDNLDNKPLLHQFQEDIEAVIDKYKGERLTLGEAMGALECVKLNLWHTDNEDGA